MASSDPAAILNVLMGGPMESVEGGRTALRANWPPPSDRKLRLFGLNLYLAYVAKREERWDGAPDFAWIDTNPPPCEGWNLYKLAPVDFANRAIESYTLHNKDPKYEYIMVTAADAATLLREIVGNPFRPLPYLRWSEGEAVEEVQPQKPTVERCVPWLTPTVIALAESAYSERAERKCERCKWEPKKFDPSRGLLECPDCHGTGRIQDGSLDNDRLAVLSDALEESGVTDADILNHLRGPGSHWRGCWCLDIILGKA